MGYKVKIKAKQLMTCVIIKIIRIKRITVLTGTKKDGVLPFAKKKPPPMFPGGGTNKSY